VKCTSALVFLKNMHYACIYNFIYYKERAMRYSLLITFFSMSILSCGPSAEEKASMERAKQDSIASAAAAAAMVDSVETNDIKGEHFNRDIPDTYCCSNHDPQHCGTRSDLKALSTTYGCSGFHN
jgi:hypothetical protein